MHRKKVRRLIEIKNYPIYFTVPASVILLGGVFPLLLIRPENDHPLIFLICVISILKTQGLKNSNIKSLIGR